MEMMKVLAVAKQVETNKYTNKEELRVYIGEVKSFANGYVPAMKECVKKNGDRFYLSYYSIGLDILKGYTPQPGDLVNVSFDRYGNLIHIARADA